MSRLYGPHADVVLDALYERQAALLAMRDNATAVMAASDTFDPDDWDRYDKAAAAYDETSDELADIDRRIEELENLAARAYERSNTPIW